MITFELLSHDLNSYVNNNDVVQTTNLHNLNGVFFVCIVDTCS